MSLWQLVATWIAVVALSWRVISQTSRIHLYLDRAEYGRVPRAAKQATIAMVMILAAVVAIITHRDTITDAQALGMIIVLAISMSLSALMFYQGMHRLVDKS